MEQITSSQNKNGPSNPTNTEDKLLEQVLLAQKLVQDPKIIKLIGLMKETQTSTFDKLEEEASEKVSEFKMQAQEYLDQRKDDAEHAHKGAVRIYVDGCFDLPHAGHYNAIRQAKQMGDWLVAGVNSDADILRVKGPTILSGAERSEIVRHCKFIDEVSPDTAYTPSEKFLKGIGCHFYAHGDDPTFDSDGTDITIKLRELGMFK